MPGINRVEIDRRFDLHTPTAPDVNGQLDRLRAAHKELAILIAETTPVNREQSLAITSLEESLYWTVGAIVRPSA